MVVRATLHTVTAKGHEHAIVVCTATHMQGGPYAYASHYALSGIRKLGACTSLASPNASHYAARRTPPPSKINRKRQYIHVIIACVTVRWPCGCLIRTTCHVYGLWISAGAPRPAPRGKAGRLRRITYPHYAYVLFTAKLCPGDGAMARAAGALRTTSHVYGLCISPRAPPSPPPPLTYHAYALRIRYFSFCARQNR